MSFNEIVPGEKLSKIPSLSKILLAMLIVDCSASMDDVMAKLNSMLREMMNQLREDPKLRKCVELAMYSFSDTVKQIFRFLPVDKVDFADLEVDGYTNLFGGLKKGIETTCQHYDFYKGQRVPTYKPHIFLLTDGNHFLPDSKDNPENIKKLIKEVELLREKRKFHLHIFALGNIDLDLLKKLTEPEMVYDLEKSDKTIHDTIKFITTTIVNVSKGKSSPVPPLKQRNYNGN